MAIANNNAPTLRFPSFTEEWEEKTLGEVFKTYSGGTPDTTKKKTYYGGTIPFIRSAEINKEETELFLTQEGLENSSAKLVNKGDLLVALYGANSGDSAIAKINGAINQAVLCLQSENSNVFVQNFLLHNRELIIQKYLQGGQGNLSGEIIKSIRVPFPSSKEQQKIAACLSSLDELITTAGERLNALKAHKKGLLQRLFPREGSNTPELRFAGFKGAWKEKRLGEVANVVRGGSPRPIDEYLTSDKDGLNWLKIGDISSEAKYITSTSEKVKQSALKKTRVVREGELILSNSMSFGRPYILKISTCIHDGWIAIKDIKNETFEEFLHYFISSEEIQKYFKSKVAGGIVKNLKASTIQDLPILFPSLPEQQKIASCLSSLDTLLEKQQERIALLKTHKKGLLQQLFPNY